MFQESWAARLRQRPMRCWIGRIEAAVAIVLWLVRRNAEQKQGCGGCGSGSQ
jgi:hypothetical protein